MENPILIRCDDCAEASCLLDCGEEFVSVAGDLLVDAANCEAGGLPSCVAACDKSAKKTVRGGSLREKRIKIADRIY
jgi:hypothetical protein